MAIKRNLFHIWLLLSFTLFFNAQALAQSPTDGLIGLWTLDDELSGLASDSSGNANDGVLVFPFINSIFHGISHQK